jgi:hypothetical protein
LHHQLHAALRAASVGLLSFLPSARRTALERWLRGREEHGKLAEADVVLVSWAKSGRTWLRLMLSRFYQQRYALPAGSFLEFDNLHRRNPAIPRVFFTHGNYLRNYTGNWDSKCDFHGKRIVLLVRDPRDVAVSQYFQWAHRMRPRKKRLNDYPAHGSDISLFEFVARHDAGLTRIIEFFNLWAQELSHLESALVLRYEDMRREPEATLGRALAFMGAPAEDAELRDAVEYAAFENMRRLEQGGTNAGASGRRLVPGRRGDPNSYKVRRAKVGGYRDYFDPSEQAEIDGRVARELTPIFGYTGPEPDGLPSGSRDEKNESIAPSRRIG